MKAHCKRGHPRTPENVSVNKSCKLCNRLYRKPNRERVYSVEHLYATLKRYALRRGIAMRLSFRRFCVLRSYNCIYCTGPLPRTGYGIDRKDNSKAYTIENCVPCCRVCNETNGKHLSFKEMMLVMNSRRDRTLHEIT